MNQVRGPELTDIIEVRWIYLVDQNQAGPKSRNPQPGIPSEEAPKRRSRSRMSAEQESAVLHKECRGKRSSGSSSIALVIPRNLYLR